MKISSWSEVARPSDAVRGLSCATFGARRTRHVYKRRTFYIDEDSWQAMVVDCYDNRDQIWRVQEAHSINYYDVPNLWTTLELTLDLQSGRYLAIGLNNEERMTYDFSPTYTPDDFAPATLRRAGVR